jgi:branched-chain amino acid transport system ATP-binding protein
MIGFETVELDQILGDEASEDRADPADEIEPLNSRELAVTRLGDVWICDQHRLVCGDATDNETYAVVMGRDMANRKPHLIAKAGVGFVPEDRQVFPEHSVEDNLEIAAKKGPSGQDYWNLARIYEVFPLLKPLRQRQAGRLSGGEQQMLAIARTLMGNPVALLLDEPSEGLAPIVVQRIAEILHRLRGSGASILIAEQNMHFCLGIASDATVIDKGQIVYRDTIAGLKANDEIRARYLAI